MITNPKEDIHDDFYKRVSVSVKPDALVGWLTHNGMVQEVPERPNNNVRIRRRSPRASSLSAATIRRQVGFRDRLCRHQRIVSLIHDLDFVVDEVQLE